MTAETKISVPEAPVIFRYALEEEGGGDIYVYGMKTASLNVIFITLDDTSSEWIYSYSAYSIVFRDRERDIVDNAAHELVLTAKDNLRSLKCPDEDNPFLLLHRDKDAMEKLVQAILEAFKEEEGEDA